jgi:hypothetical protein
MIYLLVLILLFFLICRFDIVGDERNKNFWCNFVLFVFIAIAGFRYRLGGDTINYLELYYHNTPTFSNFSFSAVEELGMEPLYVLLTILVKTLGGQFFWIQLIQAIVVNGLLFTYFRKHSDYVFTCIFIYAIWFYTLFNYEEMRASISLAICLFANDYILDKKWVKGMSLYIIGCLFHYSTIMLLITPLMLFLKFNLLGIMVMCMAIPLSVVAEKWLGDYMILMDLQGNLSEKAIGYLNNEDYHQVHGIMFYIIDLGFFIFYIVSAYWYVHKKQLRSDLLRFQPFLLIGLFFFFAKSNFWILYRFGHFYFPYFVLFISTMFGSMIRDNLDRMKSLAWMRTLVFFLPFFYLITYGYFSSPPRMLSKSYRNYQKHYPYASIFEKDIDKEREDLFDNLFSVNKLHSNVNEDEY